MIRCIALLLLAPYSVSSAACSVCEDGSAPTLPDKIIDIPGLPKNLLCRQIHAVVPLLIPDESSDECIFTRRLSSICGCPRQPDSCNLCPDGSAAPNAATPLPSFYSLFVNRDNQSPSCEVVEAYTHSFPSNSSVCLQSQQNAASICGCVLKDNVFDRNESDSGILTIAGNESLAGSIGTVDMTGVRFNYFGSTEYWQLDQLMLIFRIASIMSVVAAFIVILDNLRNHKRLKKNIYNQLIVIMAGFDIIFSIAIALIEIPRPTNDLLSSNGERGNDTTCKIQGWFTQWGGLTSLFLNVSLATCK